MATERGFLFLYAPSLSFHFMSSFVPCSGWLSFADAACLWLPRRRYFGTERFYLAIHDSTLRFGTSKVFQRMGMSTTLVKGQPSGPDVLASTGSLSVGTRVYTWHASMPSYLFISFLVRILSPRLPTVTGKRK